VVLKPLADALPDGDNIYAVLKGTAVTQDGHTNGITVPNGESQKLAVSNALKSAGFPLARLLRRGPWDRHGRR
jgi:acyl transferase domain-containing protein